MLSIKRSNTLILGSTKSLKKRMSSKSLLNLAIALLPSAAMALTLPKTPCVLNLFWATGYEGILEAEKISPKAISAPSVEIGGPTIGSKKTFDTIEKFLKECQKQQSPTTILFALDKPTYWANKEHFDRLSSLYPNSFRPFFLNEFVNHPEVQKCPKILPFLNKSFNFMPVIGSDIFRLLAPFFPEALKLDQKLTSHPWSWMYTDIDNFVDGIEQDGLGKKSSLNVVLKQSPHSADLFATKVPFLNNSVLRLEMKPAFQESNQFKEYITQLKHPLDKQPMGFPYFDHLMEILKGNHSVESYLSTAMTQQRKEMHNPRLLQSITGRHLLKKLMQKCKAKILHSSCPHCALSWTGGIYFFPQHLVKDSFVKKCINNNKNFMKNYIESIGIMNDLLKFSKAQQWLLWQQNYLQQGLPSVSNLKKLIDTAFERLMKINPFEKITFKGLSRKYIRPDRPFSRSKGRECDTVISAMQTLGKKLTQSYPDYALMHEYKKKNKVFKLIP